MFPAAPGVMVPALAVMLVITKPDAPLTAAIAASIAETLVVPPGTPPSSRALANAVALAALAVLAAFDRKIAVIFIVAAVVVFAMLRLIAERNGLPLLSMGMSADFATAIQLGATHVRIGTAIFGARAPRA